jgi:hypothetical protein
MDGAGRSARRAGRWRAGTDGSARADAGDAERVMWTSENSESSKVENAEILLKEKYGQGAGRRLF